MKNLKLKPIIRMFLVLSCCLFFMLGVAAFAQDENIKIGKEEEAFAKQALGQYVQNYLTQENVTRFGFDNLGQSREAVLGKPVQLMVINIDKLRAYKSGTAPKNMMTDVQTLWYPVLVQNVTITKMEIIKKNGKLIAGEFGKVKIAKEIMSVREKLAKMIEGNQVKAPEEELLIEIPFLRAMFIYVKNADGEHLVPAMIQPERFEMENGVVYPAGEVLSILAKIAAGIDKEKIIG